MTMQVVFFLKYSNSPFSKYKYLQVLNFLLQKIHKVSLTIIKIKEQQEYITRST